MPHQMSRALQRQGIEIIPLIERPDEDVARPLHVRIMHRLRAERNRRTPVPIRKLLDNTLSRRTRDLLIREVERRSSVIQARLDELDGDEQTPDAIFGCCISSNLYALRTRLPIVYFSDATSYVLRDSYPQLMNRGESRIQALHDIERISVERVSCAVFASPMVRESAVHDLHLDREWTRVVPMGAHVYPAPDERVDAPAPAPTRDDCRLLIVAADPVRKRVDLALEATELLRERGIRATLSVVGPGTQRSNTSPAADPVGRLRLSDPVDRAQHQALLRDCHIQLLPSLGEAFGIAPIESAHYARPSIVANAGGLSYVVLHGKTGLVLDVNADAEAWANAVESMIHDPDRYRAMSEAALARAREELNWDAWGESVAEIIRETIAAHT